MTELWEKIQDAPLYEISNLGRVRSSKYGHARILKPTTKASGYQEIGLCVKPGKRKWFLIHRLVLSTFQPVANMEQLEVNHKDEDKSNNQINNLEWVTSKENCNYGTRNQRSTLNKIIPVLCNETGVVYSSFHEAAKLTGIAASSINMCCTGYRNRKTAGGYHWRYANE